jgi:putative ATPase
LEEDPYLKPRAIEIDEWESLLLFSGGDARKLLNTLDLIVSTQKEGETLHITNELCKEIIQENPGKYDKTGEQHYDIISAFIKSIRGSDPNATMYYLARMVEGGEDPKFIARRMLILASEDIGLANPTAMILANSCFQAVTFIGYPECDLILSETALYLCSSPKSNSAYVAIRSARKLARESDFQVPLHLRNAPTALLEELGYGAEYQYAHNFPGNFISQEFLPAGLEGTTFFQPSDNARERDIREFLRSRWKEKYGY